MTHEKDTPMMKQHAEIKAKYPDAILLFRVGDFYETFGEDAVKASEALGITLTKRSHGKTAATELAGFPHHAIDVYLPKLVRAGYRVAVCDQLEDPRLTKNLVKRGLTELVTPGVSYGDSGLDGATGNYLCGLHFGRYRTGIAFLDISTGEFFASEGNPAHIRKLLSSFQPKEILYQKDLRDKFAELQTKVASQGLDEWIYTDEAADTLLKKQFGVQTLKGYGIDGMPNAAIAAGSILYYLEQTQHFQTSHITGLRRIDNEKYAWIDRFTARNLEIFEPTSPDGRTLFDVVNRCKTAMGMRGLKRRLSFPLKDPDEINSRLNCVGYFFDNPPISQDAASLLKGVGDLERLIAKAAVGRISPRELLQMKNALKNGSELKGLLAGSDCPDIARLAGCINDCAELREKIDRMISDDPPASVAKGGAFKEGANEELDRLRKLAGSGKEYLQQMQIKESENTGIASLKVGYNNVFGYFFEVRNSQKDKVPASWIRRQTLVNAERYITEELKHYEEEILSAEENMLRLEAELYAEILAFIGQFMDALQQNADMLTQLDISLGLAELARANNYCRPEISDDLVLDIKGGRHPVIETQMKPGEKYVENDVRLDDKDTQIIIITGPNMAGKSALLRQTALITLLAQMGSFVPATSAHIGIVDKIFTRVGASDNISMGESTFMVEMSEAAGILNNLSARSLVLFDELGRGTSTYDGISIAWAIVEYIHENPSAKARTLFATHYHELNEMEKDFARIKNYNVSVREIDGRVIFLRKLVEGGSEHSFGIHVAKIAGVPPSIIRRANDILHALESNNDQTLLKSKRGEIKVPAYQPALFEISDPVVAELRRDLESADIENMTPLAALNKLNEIKNRLENS